MFSVEQSSSNKPKSGSWPLEQAIKNYVNADQQLILKAYQFAAAAHAGQKRQSGDPYISHCVAVAIKLADLRIDAAAIAAALLHDVVEDTRFDIGTIRKNFGAQLASLVDGLTKLDNVRLTKRFLLFGPIEIKKVPEFERHIETLRKLFLATAKDIRIIIIKLADRLHNMETLDGLAQDRQKAYALETLELYAPVAYRLGMHQLKGELEDLAFPYAYPKAYLDIRKLSGPTYEQCSVIAQLMREKVEDLLKKQNIQAQTDARPKHRYSLWKKLQRYNNDLSQIYDLVAVRIIVDTLETCYKVLDIIHHQFPPVAYRIKDYIAHPKPNGYQSIHTAVKDPNGQIVEIQIRTQAMHEQAEYGIAAHWMYKHLEESRLSSLLTRFRGPKEASWLKEVAQVGKRLRDPKELEQHLKIDFFGDRIFPATPKGDIFDLPAQATTLDFAYKVHSEIGNHAVGAKVNGKMVKLSHQLKSGDVVEILTNRKARPSRDWLAIIKTAHTRSHIRRALRLRGLIPAVLRRR